MAFKATCDLKWKTIPRGIPFIHLVVCCIALPSARADSTLYDQLHDYIVNKARNGSVVHPNITVSERMKLDLANYLNNAVNTVNAVNAVHAVNTTSVGQLANATAADLTKGGKVIYSDANIFPMPSTIENPLNDNNCLEDIAKKMESFKKDNPFNAEEEDLKRMMDEEIAKKSIQDMEQKKFEILMDMFH